jgi:hypothetical protein
MNAFQRSANYSVSYAHHGYLSVLSADGSKLEYPIYLGASGSDDEVYDLALDSAGNVWVSGSTSSSDFPIKSPILPKRGSYSVFVAKFSPVVVPPPLIQITRLGSTVTITWPASASGFVLESADSLISATWVPVTATPVTSGDQQGIQLAIEGRASLFRLHKPKNGSDRRSGETLCTTARQSQGKFQAFPEWHIRSSRCSIQSRHMVTLMCSKDRQEVETLKTTLFRAGIRSEIRSNPLAYAMGITRLEIVVQERDLIRASKVRQQLDLVGSAEDAAGSPGGNGRTNGLVGGEEAELVVETEALPLPPTEPLRIRTAVSEPGGGFAQATALLEKEFEELIAREGQLVDRSRSLEEKVKTLDESLAQASADLAREVSKCSSAEKKLAEACEARASLQKEMQALELRVKASERALAASQTRFASQTQEANVQLARIADLTKEVSSRDTQLESVAKSLAATRAGMEQEKSLRLAVEQKCGELAAVRKSLESQLAQQVQQREQLLSEQRDEHEQVQACVGKVNNLRSRLRARLAEKQG